MSIVNTIITSHNINNINNTNNSANNKIITVMYDSDDDDNILYAYE